MKVKKNIAISDSGFLFNPSTGDSFSLNSIGQIILTLLKEEQTDEQIIEHVLNNYLTDINSIEKDLYDFKNMLKNYKITDND